MPQTKLLKGLASNSASPTDTWILSSNTYNGPVFMKWFMYEEKTPLVASMMYETKIYTDVTNPLIKHQVCPHFVRCLDGNRDSKMSNLMDILSNSSIEDREVVLKRSMYYQKHGLPFRPSITDPTMTPSQRTFFKSLDFPKRVRMGYTATEAIDGTTTITLQDFVRGLLTVAPSSVERYSQTLVHILFQLSVTSYAMNLSKMTHNDLHIGNVWVRNDPEGVCTYSIDNDVYSFKSGVFCMVYDFDRSYVKRLGKNPLLEQNPALCREASSCNAVNMGLDLLKVHCYLRKMLTNTPFERVVDSSLGMLLKNKEDVVQIVDYLDTPGCFLNKKTTGRVSSMPVHLYGLVERAPDYTNKLSRMISGVTRVPSPSGNVYICSKTMFDADGVLHPNRRPLLHYDIHVPSQDMELEDTISDQSLLTFSQLNTNL